MHVHKSISAAVIWLPMTWMQYILISHKILNMHHNFMLCLKLKSINLLTFCRNMFNVYRLRYYRLLASNERVAQSYFIFEYELLSQTKLGFTLSLYLIVKHKCMISGAISCNKIYLLCMLELGNFVTMNYTLAHLQ